LVDRLREQELRERNAWLASKLAKRLLYVRQPAGGEDYWWGSARAGG
jgi:hypothetical protein